MDLAGAISRPVRPLRRSGPAALRTNAARGGGSHR